MPQLWPIDRSETKEGDGMNVRGIGSLGKDIELVAVAFRNASDGAIMVRCDKCGKEWKVSPNTDIPTCCCDVFMKQV